MPLNSKSLSMSLSSISIRPSCPNFSMRSAASFFVKPFMILFKKKKSSFWFTLSVSNLKVFPCFLCSCHSPLRVETMSQRLSRTFMEYYKGFELGHSVEELEKIKNLKLKDLNKYIKEHKEILDISFAIVTK